ncbi:arsenate reductase/protein-tyrosine-phosphatase family protein [Gryllotalpicola ginsengisoli]|uniref:arsenate reductase/protein-tyrosine-phosphatase family protein n=1 Tax=Gryllotalpicola ginsengisoli TaxID=444608 RepID=UPI000686399B|nr:low molecular weight phosphatase family protein [Gryllotalpicola ginsengisoli]
MTEPFRILAVCSGNVCRSPLVELLLTRGLAARPDFAVASAGTIARPGQRMTDEMVAVASRYGIDETDARAHGASRLSEPAVIGADLILALTREHRSAAVELDPRAIRRAFTLTEFARLCEAIPTDESRALTPSELVARAAESRGTLAPADPQLDDVEDPIGLPQDVYDRVGEQIAGAVEIIVDALGNTAVHVPEAAPEIENHDGPKLSFSFRR